jgi:hypothetical protein
LAKKKPAREEDGGLDLNAVTRRRNSLHLSADCLGGGKTVNAVFIPPLRQIYHIQLCKTAMRFVQRTKCRICAEERLERAGKIQAKKKPAREEVGGLDLDAVQEEGSTASALAVVWEEEENSQHALGSSARRDFLFTKMQS